MKRLILIGSLVLLMSGAMIGPSTSADDFEILWAIDLPRTTYFIGETVSFNLLAFSSGEPSIPLPSEMALVTIRNQSMAECYAGWFTTDQNGTSPVQWDIPLESSPDNYTIILQPISGGTYTKNFTALFDQDTYWQKRVEFLEDELNRQYEYLNFLFGSNKYLLRQVDILKDRIAIMGVVMFITIMATLVVVIPEWARRSTNFNPKSMSSRVAKLMGFSSTPKVLLSDQHDELAQLKTPEGKKPPRYGLDFHCQFCDPDKLEPMTKFQYEEHLKSHYKTLWNTKARRRNKVYKQLIDEHYQIPEARPPHEKLIEAEKKRDEIVDSIELSRKELRAIAAEKKRYQADMIAEKKRLEKERKKSAKAKKMAKTVKPKKVKPVVKDSPPPMPEVQRKVRRVKHHSAIPVAVSVTDSKTFEFEDDAVPFRKIKASERSPIDDLFDQLSNERVNR